MGAFRVDEERQKDADRGQRSDDKVGGPPPFASTSLLSRLSLFSLWLSWLMGFWEALSARKLLELTSTVRRGTLSHQRLYL